MFKFDFNKIEIFREVVLLGSFSKAALKLKQPKSRISRNIAILEKQIGVQLIYRTTRQFQLTSAGRLLFQKTGPLLDELKSEIDRVSHHSDGVYGVIRITVSDDIGIQFMGRICHEFMTTYPQVTLELQTTNHLVDLVKESFDVAVRIGKINDSSMIQKKIGQVSVGLFINPSLVEKYDLQKIEDIEKVPFLSFSLIDTEKNLLQLKKSGLTKKIAPKRIFSSNNFFVLRELATRSAGFTLLPTFLVDAGQLNSQNLIQFFPEWNLDRAPIQILIPQQKEIPMRIKKFTEFLQKKIGKEIN